MDASLYRNSLSGRPRLRVGLLLDGFELPRWAAEIVDHIAGSDFASIELVVINESVRKVERESLLFAVYRRWDRRNAKADNPLAITDCSERLSGIGVLRARPIEEGNATRIPEDAVEAIRDCKLDVLIRLGFDGRMSGGILAAARCGLWSFRHADVECYRGGPPYFWELVEGNPISGAVLDVAGPDGEPRILYSGSFATQEGFSQARNAVQPYWGASTFVIQKLRELHMRGWESLERRIVTGALYRGRRKHYSSPSNLEMLRWLLPLLVGKAVRKLTRRPTIQHWKVALRFGGSPIADLASIPDLSGFRWIESPRGHCYADPFLVEEGGKQWVFFESYEYATQLGRILCAEVRDGGLGEPLVALQGPKHLSYPCVFRDSGTWYMIPETISSGTVELYRCVRFPDQWELVRVLLEGFAVDTTVWIENGVYWFFVTFLEPRGNASQLWLYSATSLTGAWTPHPENPISTDVRTSRGGGAIFRHGGKLFRPSQDDSGEYGRRLTLNEIVTLDFEHYREVPRTTIDPDGSDGLVGTHTYSLLGIVEMIDGKSRLPAAHVL